MGHNVQSQAGESITDVYDVRGGQAPIERILTSEVQATHDMAGTIFSERFSMFVRNRTFVTAQSLDFVSIIDDLPLGFSRVLGVVVGSLDPLATSFVRCAVSIEDPVSSRGMPFWVWKATDSIAVRMLVESSEQELNVMIPEPGLTQMPQIVCGNDQPQNTPNIAIRGSTAAFGAGTVRIQLQLLMAFADIGGISSRGLPVPSW